MKSFMYQWGSNINKMALIIIGVFYLYMGVEIIILHERYAALFEEFGLWRSIYGLLVVSSMFIMVILLITSLAITLITYTRR